MRIDIMTLFPEMLESYLGESIIGRARAKGLLEICCHNIRDYTEDKHRRVDDTPYSERQGMLMQAEPIYQCFQSVKGERDVHTIYVTPAGKKFSQRRAEELARGKDIVILCGHYEGVDERVIEEIVDEEISVGDFVLTGGELPALCITDAVARMIDGVLSRPDCYIDESHYSGLLEYPQYTRPEIWRGKRVPEVLLSGHHENIKKWRHNQSLMRTADRRQDMIEKYDLSDEDKKFLSEYMSKKQEQE
ncbi:MAG: tRNA (guanosine(37)-N1)-methyltransferase TrmD [Ruminococcus sp.]|nr:tRNA (guanosine(37)-N1)-methyltransferase TrmD [Ruminococcus sp.]